MFFPIKSVNDGDFPPKPRKRAASNILTALAFNMSFLETQAFPQSAIRPPVLSTAEGTQYEIRFTSHEPRFMPYVF